MEEIVNAQKVTLERLNQIFEEREKEFALRESNFAKIQEVLDRQEEQIKQKMEELKGLQTAYDEKYAALQKKERELNELSDRLEKEKKSFDAEKTSADANRENILMETSMLKEEMRNEKLKAERLREEYENRLALLDMDVVEWVKQGFSTSDPGIAAKEREELKAKILELERENAALSKEKQDLLRKLISALPFEGNEAHDNQSREAAAGETEPSTETTEASEELTAAVLYRYLLHTERDAKIRTMHSDSTDQIFMEKKGLSYRFIFDEPAYFDVRAKRRKDRNVMKAIGRFNNEKAGIKFAYDDPTGEVVATGYFIPEMTAYDLMRSVHDLVDDCFEED